MSASKPVDCRHCGEPIVIRPIRDGRRWPFNRAMQAPADVPEELRWVPRATTGRGVVMWPVADVSTRKLAGVRWYATRHACAEYFRAHRLPPEPDGLDVALTGLFGELS